MSISTFLRNRNRKHGLELADVTVGSLPGGGTGAVEGSVSVHTSSAVLTRKVQTLVHVYKYSQHILKIEQNQNALPTMSMQYYFNFLFSFYFSFFFLELLNICMYLFRTGAPPSLVCKYTSLLLAFRDRLRCFHKGTGCKYWCLAKVRIKGYTRVFLTKFWQEKGLFVFIISIINYFNF